MVKTHCVRLGPTLNSQNWRQGDGFRGDRYQIDVQMVWRLSKTIQTSLANAKVAGIRNKRLLRWKVVYRAYFDMRVRGTRWVVVEIRRVLDTKKYQMTWLKYAKGCKHLANRRIDRFALCFIVYIHICMHQSSTCQTHAHWQVTIFHACTHRDVTTWYFPFTHTSTHDTLHTNTHTHMTHSHAHTHTDMTRHGHAAYAHIHTRHIG